jgi:hypothetical protein
MVQRAVAAFVASAAILAAAPASAQLAACGKFRAAMARAGGDLNADFVRPLVVSRGGSTGVEQYDLTSNAKLDGSLQCRGETFVSFEVKVHLPAEGGLSERFATAQMAAMIAGLGWAPGRAKNKVASLASDAAEYLRGSAERGDVVVAGKVEEHLPGGADIGAVWTATERTFILLNRD